MSKGTILVIDDEPIIRYILVDALESEGYTVFDAANDTEALAVIRSDTHLDVIVSDINLSGSVSGQDIVRIALSLRNDVKIVFVTGYVKAVALNNDEFGDKAQTVLKPFKTNEIVDIVNNLISPQ